MLRLLTTVSWRHVKRHRLSTAADFLWDRPRRCRHCGDRGGQSLADHLVSIDHRSDRRQSGVAGRQRRERYRRVFVSAYSRHGGCPRCLGGGGRILARRGVPGERLYVYGVDLLTDFAIRDHQFVDTQFGFDQALDFIAQPDSIALTESFSRRLKSACGRQGDFADQSGQA